MKLLTHGLIVLLYISLPLSLGCQDNTFSSKGSFTVASNQDDSEAGQVEVAVPPVENNDEPAEQANDHETMPVFKAPKVDVREVGPPEKTPEELPTLKESLDNPPANDEPEEAEEQIPEVQTIEIPSSWKRLAKRHEVWIDVEAKQVIAAGIICLREGPLEVFACPRRTKEHESIVSLNALGSEIHAALLALDANPGHPVKWQDEYEPATGPIINIDVVWMEKEQKKTIRAQEMVLNIRTGEVMQENWVFGGSASFTDEDTGETHYYGDSGELVCLSNFSTATFDVPVESGRANEGLLYATNTENIPEYDTKVYLIFKPEIPADDSSDSEKTEDQTDAAETDAPEASADSKDAKDSDQ